MSTQDVTDSTAAYTIAGWFARHADREVHAAIDGPYRFPEDATVTVGVDGLWFCLGSEVIAVLDVDAARKADVVDADLLMISLRQGGTLVLGAVEP
jgi:hypothetical protein